MRQAVKYIFGGLLLGAIAVGFLYFFGLPRNGATGKPLIVLVVTSLGCVGYGVFLAFTTKDAAVASSRHRLPRRGSMTTPVSDPQERPAQGPGQLGSITQLRPLAPSGAISGDDARIAGHRHILWPSHGIALTIGDADLNGRGSFLATAYLHPDFVGLDQFPSISRYSGMRHETPFLLFPVGPERGFDALSLKVLLAGVHAGSSGRVIDCPGGKSIPVLELIARTVALLPELSHWQKYAKDGHLRSIIIPPEIADAMKELMLSDEADGCRFVAAQNATRPAATDSRPSGPAKSGGEAQATSMKRDHGYVVVSATAYMNPETKVSIREGRFNMETNGTQDFNVYFDPNIDGDRLLIPQRDTPLYTHPIINLPGFDENHLVPFYSLDRQLIFEFGFYFASKQKDTRILMLQMSDFYLDNPDKLRTKFPTVLQERDVADWMFEAIMVAFRHYAPTDGLLRDIQQLELWCARSLLAKLSNHSPAQADDLVLISRREVAAEH